MLSGYDVTDLATERTPRVAAARALLKRSRRAEERAFLVEGPQAVREALRYHDTGEPGAEHPHDVRVNVRRVFVDADVQERHQPLLDAAIRVGVEVVPATAKAVAGLSDTVTPQGVVAVCDLLDVPAAHLLAGTPRLLAVAVEVRDPGNAGAIIRCADAAGADGIVMAGDCVDVYNSKAVRSSAGSIFHLPIARERDPLVVVERLRTAGVTVLAAEGGGDTDLDDLVDAGGLDGPVAWLFGNEAHGLAHDVAAAADHRVAIGIHGLAESLNLATASAVCLFATARAHRP